VSILAVAREAGVSVATVSRVFNMPDKVSPETRKRVEAVARRIGWLPNASARTLRTQKSRVLGIVLPTLLNPVFAECLQGLALEAARRGYAIVPVTTEYELAREASAVAGLQAASVDGMVLVVSNPARSAALRRLREAGLPYVLAYNRHRTHPCVGVDGEQAVAEVVARLASLGHRRIAMVTGQLAVSDRAQQRHRGYLAGIQAAGQRPLVLEIPFVDANLDALSRLLGRAQAPTALVCSNDLLALRSIRAATQSGLRVPADLSVIGFDGIALGSDLPQQLGSVVQPNALIGQTAATLLIDALERRAVPTAADSRTLPWTLRLGETCAAPARVAGP
jgi:DNA-binding LacI/PurR family transcriptional regulator